MDRRTALRSASGLLALGVAGCLGGPDGGAGGDDAGETGGADDGDVPETTPGATLGRPPSIDTPAFADGEPIPTRYTCDGEDVSPPLSIADVSDGAASLALLVDDPDAPGGTFTHWLLWRLPVSTTEVPEAVPGGQNVDALGGARQGTNDADRVGYSGPCPPPDDGAHTYRFRLFALGDPLNLEPGADRSAFDEAVSGVARSEAVLRGTYDR